MIETIKYDKKHKEREELDFYTTPIEEVKAILKLEPLKNNTVFLDPCCGTGNISGTIKDDVRQSGLKIQTIETDILKRNYECEEYDFLNKDYPYTEDIDYIIINPPFKDILPFVKKSLLIAQKKLIVFARIQFLETEKRYKELFENNPPTRIYIYVDRISCKKGGDETSSNSNSMCFAWFVWDKENPTKTTVEWIRREDKLKPKTKTKASKS